MKTGTATLAAAPDLAEPGLLTDLMTLTKARLSLLVIITTFVGFCMASGASLDRQEAGGGGCAP